jgi:predicted nucleic acid-binding protein
MRVVADTTVFRYLVLIDAIALLPALFTQVVVPPAVVAELQHASTPAPVRTWMAAPPAWLVIHPPRRVADPRLAHLGAGEREALVLMHEHQGVLLVTDDREAYRTALAQAIPVVRTLRLLEIGAERGLLDFSTAIARLRAAGFYLPTDIVDEMLARDAARKAAAAPPATGDQRP